MGVISLLPLSALVPSTRTPLLASPLRPCPTARRSPRFILHRGDFVSPSRRSRGFTARGGGVRGRGDGEEAPTGAAFLDEDGVVKDMDAYLDRLSLEYDSVWDTKPSWCQPWTIVLTGALATGCSWVIFHSTLATAVVFSLVSAWWYLFLYIYPKDYADMIAERRRNVKTGVEDTFGVRKDE